MASTISLARGCRYPRLRRFHRFPAVLTEARTSSFTVRAHSICAAILGRNSIASSLDLTAWSLRPYHGAMVTGASPLFFCNTSIQQHNTRPLNSGKNLYCLRRLARPYAQHAGSAGTPLERRRNAVGSPSERSNERARAQKKERRAERSSPPPALTHRRPLCWPALAQRESGRPCARFLALVSARSDPEQRSPHATPPGSAPGSIGRGPADRPPYS